MIETGKSKHDEKWFSTRHLKDNLKSQTVHGGISTITGQALSFIFTFLSTIIMARILTPNDYGLVTMVTAFTGFVTIFKDLGLSAAIIQKEEIEQQQVSAVFWINVLISLGIAIIAVLLAPVLVSLYKEPRLFNIALVFAASIFISGFSLQHNALMKRQMKFKTLSVLQVISSCLSITISVLMAFTGFGYWAIVASIVLNPLLSTIALWFVCDWRPAFIFKASDTHYFLKYGIGITGFDMINYFSRNFDNMLIGKYEGKMALGLYTKAYQLLMLPITQLRDPLNSVALPALSTLQNNQQKFADFYKRYIFTFSFFSMPLVIYLAIFSDELILTVLGPQWIGASYIFKLLAISSFIQPIAGTRGTVLIAIGKTQKYFIFGLMNTLSVVIGFIIGIQWGVTGIAISYAIVNYITLIPTLYYCFHKTPVTVSLFFKEISLPALFSVITGIILIIIRQYTDTLPPIIILITGFTIAIMVYYSLWYISSASRRKIAGISDIRKMITNKIFKH